MLVTTIEQVRAVANINVSNTIDNLAPYLDESETSFIIPVISKALFDAVIDNEKLTPELIQGQVPEDDKREVYLTDLAVMLRKAISLYALYLFIDEIGVSISAAGIQEIESSTHKPAPQFKIMNIKETFLSRAHKQIDLILEYIENDPASFGRFDVLKADCFIKSASHFQQFFDIHTSRRVFLALLPVMQSIENKYIKPTLSPLLFDLLKAEYLSGNFSQVNHIEIHNLIAPALIHLTMARALLDISISTLDWGIFNSAANTFNNIQSKIQANEKRVAAMHSANQLDGEAELKALQEYLDTTASETILPLYFNSTRYSGPLGAIKGNEFINDVSKSIFIV